MKIELLCRYKKMASSDEEKAQLEAQRIISGKDTIEEVMTGEFEYGPLTMDLRDVRIWNRVDDEHICVRTYQQDSYVFKVEYELFSQIYEERMGVNVYIFTKE